MISSDKEWSYISHVDFAGNLFDHYGSSETNKTLNWCVGQLPRNFMKVDTTWGEDAYFVDPHGMGVADGVGCMVQFASYGINAAQYAAELLGAEWPVDFVLSPFVWLFCWQLQNLWLFSDLQGHRSLAHCIHCRVLNRPGLAEDGILLQSAQDRRSGLWEEDPQWPQRCFFFGGRHT